MRQLSIIASMDKKSGGPAQAIRYLFPYFEKDYSIVDVLCPIWNDFDISNSEKGLNFRLYSKTTNVWSYNKEIKSFLKNHIEDYELVIVHGLWLYNLLAVFQVIEELKQKASSKIPVFLVFAHGMLDPWFQQTVTRRVKAFRNVIYWYLIQEKILRNADGILFTCEEEMLLARTTFSKYKPQNEFNVGYGIPNPPSFTPQMTLALKEKFECYDIRPFIIYMGRIDQKKGLDLLVKVYVELLQNNDNIDNLPILLIAGPGQDSAFGKRINKYINQHPILNNFIVFVGMLTGDAKWGAIYHAEAFVLPSHQENFGIAVVEALACGIPVLISNKINIWREIQNGGGGLIAEDTFEGTFDLLQKWLSLSSDSKKMMGNNAIKVYEINFKIELAAHNIILAYKKVMESRKSNLQIVN
jgi:glycosyltransferase involved in cell wall biosynthesis